MSASKIMSGAAALLAFTGMASASLAAPRAPMYPRGYNTTNSVGPTASLSTTSSATTPVSFYTTASTTTSSAASSATGGDDGAFCPAFDLQVILSATSIEFLLECNTNHFGLLIDIVFNGLFKRQDVLPTNIGDCMDICSTNDLCIATSFNTETQICQFFETVGAAFTAPNTDFALRVSGTTTGGDGTGADGTGAGGEPTLAPSNTVTGTITQTAIGTIYSCAATVTDCPYDAHKGYLTTETISLFTTYCPGNSAVATGNAVGTASGSSSAVTATVYSPTVATFTGLSTTSTIYVPVATAVVNYPIGAKGTAASVVATTTAAYVSGAASATGAVASPSVSAFLGAAGHVEAGMGLAGAAALMAFVL